MSQDLFYIPGLQLPDNLLNLDSNVIIRKSKWIVNEKSNKNLKFSLKIGNEDVSGTVEETKNLVALALSSYAEERTEVEEDSTESDNEVDNEEEIRYAFKGNRTARYINNQLNRLTLSHINDELRNIFGNIDSAIANGVAVEDGNVVYVIDAGIEDVRIDFGVRSKEIISDTNLRKEFIRRKNDKSIRNGYISDGLSANFGDEYDDSWNGYFRQKSEQKLSTNQGQSKDNQTRFSKSNGNNGSRRLRFSLKSLDDKYLELAKNPKANERATRWAHEKGSTAGDIAFISYDNAWYKIEVFDDLDSKYQIVKGYTEKQFKTRLERIKKYESENYSYAGSLNEGIIYHEDKGRKQGSDIARTNKGRTDSRLSEMAERENARTENRTERKGDSSSSIFDNERGIKYSLKSLDDKYLELAKNPESNEAELKRIIEEYSKMQGYSAYSDYQGTCALQKSSVTAKTVGDYRFLTLFRILS